MISGSKPHLILLTTYFLVLTSAFQIPCHFGQVGRTTNQCPSHSITVLGASFYDPPPPPPDGNDETPKFEGENIDFDSDIDWDAEWKKVASGQQDGVKRPSGRAKTEIELAAIRAKKSAETQLYKAQGEARKIKYKTNWRSLQGDW
eukprot:CAMPEP_0116064690 /NCGR_PEP_ID=MMETSP0322-20121206/9273_1 /TAXON_ID=163516 /ORGANISM="Leptocylindrus danicus var. apora, Strain B651" /LENGTH=145 /DNA_ID=CAMNT_0003550773 /DNA_START=81 /DNA_END=515 /DNA_ORIENTATION=-